MKITNYADINETLYHEELPNGLNIYFLPKQGYQKTYVTLSTPLGSNIISYKVNDKEQAISLGIAHFLEHKLFDNNGHDISEDFALNDAQVNAYTMNTRTTYLFHCTDNLHTNIKTLLDMVFYPKFSTEGIEKELGIIEQEINMFEDDPNTVIYMGLLRNLYETHPIRNDILGNVESINTITKELLVDVHSTFYNPSNMIMFVTGNIDVQEILQVIKENVPNIEQRKVVLNEINDDNKVYKKEDSRELDIMIPNTLLGVKLTHTDYSTENIIKKELTYSVLLDILLGKSTDNYNNLLKKELVNDTFGLDITLESSYGFLLFGGNTNHPEAFYVELRNILQNATSDSISTTHFNRAKKQIIGGFISALNSLEYTANQFTKFHFQNASLFNILQIAKSITIEDIKEALDVLYNEENYSSFTTYPKRSN